MLCASRGMKQLCFQTNLRRLQCQDFEPQGQLLGSVCSALHGDKTCLNASAIILFTGKKSRVFIAALDEFIGTFGLGMLNSASDDVVSMGCVRNLH